MVPVALLWGGGGLIAETFKGLGLGASSLTNVLFYMWRSGHLLIAVCQIFN